ncbi:hypothetical protein [Rhizobium leguminosarum]|uniref:hypothetical protein n=1 Tax=Rhizobium leguminosarum TaxID=384 RepID=UPI0032B2BAA1
MGDLEGGRCWRRIDAFVAGQAGAGWIGGSLSRTMVNGLSIVQAGQSGKPSALGLPLRAKLTQAWLTFLESARASLPPPVDVLTSVAFANTYGKPSSPTARISKRNNAERPFHQLILLSLISNFPKPDGRHPRPSVTN